MLGKTNIIYVAKDQNSEMQFVAETVITRTSLDIINIKYLNGIFFAFTKEDSILYGENINDLNFLKDGEDFFRAIDVEYFGGKYVFIDGEKTKEQGKMQYYVSTDLSAFEKHQIQLHESSSSESYMCYVYAVAIDSKGRLVFLTKLAEERYGAKFGFYICICTDPTDDSSFEILYKNGDSILGVLPLNRSKRIFFINDRFLCFSMETGTSARKILSCIMLDTAVETIGTEYYPVDTVSNMAFVSADSNTYYSLNFKNYIKVRSVPTSNCFLIGGRIGLYNDGTLELASKVTDFSAGKSTVLEIAGIDYNVLCYAATDEYTYLGCEGGIIIQCLLDVEGTYQTPEITLVRTLAAKQALAQAQKYTDEKVAELKSYVDSLSGAST